MPKCRLTGGSVWDVAPSVRRNRDSQALRAQSLQALDELTLRLEAVPLARRSGGVRQWIT